MLMRLIISSHWLPMQTISRGGQIGAYFLFTPIRGAPLYPTVSMTFLQVVKRSCRSPHGIQIGQGCHQPIHALHELLWHAAQTFVEACHPQHAFSVIGAHQVVQ